ncbi:MAG: DUF4149 domain-containing protein [Halobacteriales archaeon]|nr:DUF4149 domain-containing protein [Halobacteriales archaeon]
MLRVVDIVANGAVGVWLGAIVFFSFIVAPRAFAVLEGEKAGELVNAVFPRYYSIGATLGVVAFVAGVVRGVLDGFGLYLGLYFGTVGISVFVALVSRFYLTPRIIRSDESGEDDAFGRYHDASVKLNSVMLVSVVAALVFWHV